MRKIKKPTRPVADVVKELPVWVKASVFIPAILLLVLLCVLLFITTRPVEAKQAHANRELFLTTNGRWETFDAWGMDIWVPADLARESLTNETSNNEMRLAVRDKGGYPELGFGVIVADDVDGLSFDLEKDISGCMDVTTPLLTEALGEFINGAYPSMSIDISSIDLPNGEAGISGSGEYVATVVYQDPKDKNNQYSEEVSQNLYYNVILFHGRPVVIWGVWDYSTYEGESRTQAAVSDAVTSVLRSANGTPIIPSESVNALAPASGEITDVEPTE